MHQPENREVWFKCSRCGGESYCGAEFEHFRDPDVMCPFCRTILKLSAVRIADAWDGAPPVRKGAGGPG